MSLIYLGLGSNLGDRPLYLQQAVARLERAGVKSVRLSPIYETEPVGYKEQDWFLNAVLEGQTELTPDELLQTIRKIEKQLGRERTISNGPRTIDIDILFYDNLVLATDLLTIPHQRLHERRFVLISLADIAPDAVHPILHQAMRQLLTQCPDTSQVVPYFP